MCKLNINHSLAQFKPFECLTPPMSLYEFSTDLTHLVTIVTVSFTKQFKWNNFENSFHKFTENVIRDL